ncbi:unnamed protein product, partial [Pylaiella littoralis]
HLSPSRSPPIFERANAPSPISNASSSAPAPDPDPPDHSFSPLHPKVAREIGLEHDYRQPGSTRSESERIRSERRAQQQLPGARGRGSALMHQAKMMGQMDEQCLVTCMDTRKATDAGRRAG